MNRNVSKIEIKETLEELHQAMRRAPDKYIYRRIHFLYLLKSGQSKTLENVSEILNVHRKSVSEWLKLYEKRGLAGLIDRRKPPGRQGSMPKEIHEALRERLEGDGFDSFKEAHTFVQETGFKMNYHWVYSYIKKHFQGKLKVPRPQHIQQSPEQKVAFKKN
jgi:transposase